MREKLTYEFVKSKFEEKGYELLEDIYVNCEKKMRYKCPKHPNEELYLSYDKLKQGRGCKFCGYEISKNKQNHSFKFIKEEFEKRGFKLLETEYYNAHTKMKYKCLIHPDKELYINYNAFQQGNGCPICGIIKSHLSLKLTYEYVKEEFQKNGYELLETEYINNSTKMKYKCPKHPDKELYITYNHLKRGTRCPYCSNNGSSYPEYFLYYLLSLKFNKVEHRKKINGFEYDIYIEDLNTVIEYNGLYWHKNRKKRDELKKENCKNLNINFIIIEEQRKLVDIIVNENIIFFSIPDNKKTLCLMKLFSIIIKLLNKKFNILILDKIDDLDSVETKVKEFIQVKKIEKSAGSLMPDLNKDWHPTKNGNLTLYNFALYSCHIAWWKCHKCNNEWKTMITNRTQGEKCPICKNKIISLPKRRRNVKKNKNN